MLRHPLFLFKFVPLSFSQKGTRLAAKGVTPIVAGGSLNPSTPVSY